MFVVSKLSMHCHIIDNHGFLLDNDNYYLSYYLLIWVVGQKKNMRIRLLLSPVNNALQVALPCVTVA